MQTSDIKIFKKADLVLIIIVVLLSLAATFFFSKGTSGEEIRITVDGELYGTYNLFEDKNIMVQNGKNINRISIRGGKVSVTSANCPGKDCVHHGAISGTSESIVCLPHHLVIEIEGGESEYDDVSR